MEAAETGASSSINFYSSGQALMPQRSNLLLQMLLQTNGYISLIWSISYFLHMLVWLDQLWNYNGLAMLVAFLLAVSAETLRLYAGYSINLRTGATSMWLLLTLTPCVLLPTLVYLRLAAISGDIWLHFISNVQLLLIALEALVALIYHALCVPARDAQSETSLKGL